jgi:hypothetical protein
MSTPIVTRKRNPFDDMTTDAIQDFATFVRRVAPRWVDGSRSLTQLAARRAHQRELARGRRRGYRLFDAPAPLAPPVPSGRVVRRRRP